MDFTAVELLTDDSCGWPHISDSLADTSTVSDHNASSPVTPKSDATPVAFNFDHHRSSDVSPNHDSDSSYSEIDSEDSEAEAFYSSLNHHLVSPAAMDSHADEKQISYGELMKKYLQSEEELRTTSLKLQESELEIEKLKGETEKRESSAVLFAESLRAELETARREIDTKGMDIETEKRRALELERQVVYLENMLSDSSLKSGNLFAELKETSECLDVSEAEITNLKEMLCDVQQIKTKLQTDNAGLLKKMQRKEVELRGEIKALKTVLASRDEHIETLNKACQTLAAEKDGVYAELGNLKAEMRSRHIQIKKMDEQLSRLRCKQTELVSELGTDKKTVEELRTVVKKLEKQAELARNAIAEGAEGKREAIRQLCFSLDHYKSGYRQLLRLLSSNDKRQQAILVV